MATETPTPSKAFDADKRAEAREQAPITIGGTEYRRRRKNWETTRAMRTAMARMERKAQKANRLRVQRAELDGSAIDELEINLDSLSPEDRDSDRAKRWRARLETLQTAYDALSDDDRDDQAEDLREKIDAATDESDEAAFELISLLLRDDEGNQPGVDFLKAELDVDDVMALASELAGGGEPDPTPPETPANATS